MAAFSSIIAAIGVAASVGGTAIGFLGQQRAAEGQRRAEEARRKQMELDAMRRKREIVRQGQLARSQALATATAQGAEGGSGLQGGFGEISGRMNADILGVNQSLGLGREIFAANAETAAGQSLAGFGAGMGSLGGSLVKNSERLGKLGTFFLNRFNTAYT